MDNLPIVGKMAFSGGKFLKKIGKKFAKIVEKIVKQAWKSFSNYDLAKIQTELLLLFSYELMIIPILWKYFYAKKVSTNCWIPISDANSAYAPCIWMLLIDCNFAFLHTVTKNQHSLSLKNQYYDISQKIIWLQIIHLM